MVGVIAGVLIGWVLGMLTGFGLLLWHIIPGNHHANHCDHYGTQVEVEGVGLTAGRSVAVMCTACGKCLGTAGADAL